MGLMKRVVGSTFTGKYFLLSLCFTAACAPRKAYRIPRPWLWKRKTLCKSKAHQPRSWHGQICNALVEYVPRVIADGLYTRRFGKSRRPKNHREKGPDPGTGLSEAAVHTAHNLLVTRHGARQIRWKLDGRGRAQRSINSVHSLTSLAHTYPTICHRLTTPLPLARHIGAKIACICWTWETGPPPKEGAWKSMPPRTN